jgi:hypothetical protein
MQLSVFFDETGDLQDPRNPRHYGFGYVFLPSGHTEQVENLLLENGIHKVHSTDLTFEEKLKFADTLAELSLDGLSVQLGAVVRPHASFANDLATQFVGEEILERSDLMGIALHRARSNQKSIVLLNDVLPDALGLSRINEYFALALRYPVIRILDRFGRSPKVHLDLRFSSIGAPEDFERKMTMILRDAQGELSLFFDQLVQEGLAGPRNPKAFVHYEITAVPRNDGLYALADFASSIGHHLLREAADASHTLGTALYSRVEALFPKSVRHPGEPKPGVYFVESLDKRAASSHTP